ncbi:MAG: bifunctional UDP-N-acetylglucosamine diphosphorylase/glucosamine-1-phosphate N-acetyltransferase GlmU [Cocleimonas sp.]|nr:bifunctional UDP-N-acetylglucosamine diphosphorylase/glucosamine-1-phosphate N-acetyltransferase GlmU [Cocleimonas sp.]
MNIFPIILAAGKGTRMNSSLPKVLHLIGGKPMLQHVVNSCLQLSVTEMAIVYGHGGELVRNTVSNKNIHWALQEDQKGTGHAVAQAESLIDDDSTVIIAYGDVPLIQADTLSLLAENLDNSTLSVLTTHLDDPFGYGRIVRNGDGKILSIVEEKDATDEQRKITEVNTGFIAAKGSDLKRWLKQLKPNNSQGEYYLTDCIALAVSEGGTVEAAVCNNPLEVQGVNNRIQQAELERAYQVIKANELMLAGVTLLDPARIDIRGTVTAGKDVSIDVNTVFIGDVVLGDNVTIESACVIKDSQIARNTIIKAHSNIDSSIIGESCDIGPFARIRPETVLKANAKIGNFVETKKSTIGVGSKVSHLSYIGDTQMGENVNIGAGTITCNYDGANKFQTIIGDNVFVGSDTQLVAPVNLAKGTVIGAGSTITKDTPEGELTLSRSKQVTIKGWKRPQKAKKNDKENS